MVFGVSRGTTARDTTRAPVSVVYSSTSPERLGRGALLGVPSGGGLGENLRDRRM
jgi:hypothetical protein